MPLVRRPGRRQSISTVLAINATGGFWFAMHEGAISAELFIELLKKMMKSWASAHA